MCLRVSSFSLSNVVRSPFAHSVRILTLYRRVRVVKVTHVVNSVVSNLMSKGGASNNGDWLRLLLPRDFLGLYCTTRAKNKKKVLKLLITVVFWLLQYVSRQTTLNKVFNAWLQGIIINRYLSRRDPSGLVLARATLPSFSEVLPLLK